MEPHSEVTVRTLPIVVAPLLLPSCMGFTGGVIPDTGRFVDKTDDTADSEPPEQQHPEWAGSGADGALDLTQFFVLDQDLRGDREQPDAVRYTVTSIEGATLELSESGLGLDAGDEAILINMRGATSDYAGVGAWSFVEIASVDGSAVQLAADPGVVFTESGNEDLSDQIIALQRVPHYTSVTVADDSVLTVSDWEHHGGGLLVLRAQQGVHVQAGGVIDATGTGYAGGDTGSSGCDGYQGESITGFGIGGSCGGYYNQDIEGQYPNAGGGGCIITGGGGGYGGFGHPGDAWNTGYSEAAGGTPYGDEALAALHLGSGGGGVWNGSDGTEGPGGAGGGIVLLAASEILVDEGGSIRANGADTFAWSTGSYTYGAGGGAGGSLWLIAQQLQIAEATVLAAGGAGQDDYERQGGDGSEGRVRIDCETCNGFEHGSEEATEALGAGSDPDPGSSELPA